MRTSQNCGAVRQMRHGDYYSLVQYIVNNATGDHTGGTCYGVGDNWGLSV